MSKRSNAVLKPSVEIDDGGVTFLDENAIPDLDLRELKRAHEHLQRLLRGSISAKAIKKVRLEVDCLVGKPKGSPAVAPVYPFLLSDATEARLTVDDLINEVQFIVESADKRDPYRGTYIYSVQVMEPLNIAERVKPELLADVESEEWASEIRHGTFYHSWLYSRAPRETFRFILKAVLSHASLIEVKVALAGQNRTVKAVRLLQNP